MTDASWNKYVRVEWYFLERKRKSKNSKLPYAGDTKWWIGEMTNRHFQYEQMFLCMPEDPWASHNQLFIFGYLEYLIRPGEI